MRRSTYDIVIALCSLPVILSLLSSSSSTACSLARRCPTSRSRSAAPSRAARASIISRCSATAWSHFAGIEVRAEAQRMQPRVQGPVGVRQDRIAGDGVDAVVDRAVDPVIGRQVVARVRRLPFPPAARAVRRCRRRSRAARPVRPTGLRATPSPRRRGARPPRDSATTWAPRLGSWTRRPSAASMRKASRSGVRDTPSRSLSSRSFSRAPGASVALDDQGAQPLRRRLGQRRARDREMSNRPSCWTHFGILYTKCNSRSQKD